MASTSVVVAHGRYQPCVKLTAWETAKARFIDGLDPAERLLFDTATPENLLYTTSNAQKQDAIDSKTRRAFSRLTWYSKNEITGSYKKFG